MKNTTRISRVISVLSLIIMYFVAITSEGFPLAVSIILCIFYAVMLTEEKKYYGVVIIDGEHKPFDVMFSKPVYVDSLVYVGKGTQFLSFHTGTLLTMESVMYFYKVKLK